jgi:23S rRNA (cytosine1962-C5)-methyltransferase
MDEATFAEVLREASTRVGVDLRLLEQRGAGPDHPSDLHCPEGRYLKGFLLQRRG